MTQFFKHASLLLVACLAAHATAQDYPTVKATDSTDAVNLVTGAITTPGGASIGKNLYVGGFAVNTGAAYNAGGNAYYLGTTDTNPRLAIYNSGLQLWGSGSAPGDTSIARDAVKSLAFDAAISFLRPDGAGAIGMNRRHVDGTSPNTTRHRWQISYNLSATDFWRLEHFGANGAFINSPFTVDAAGDVIFDQKITAQNVTVQNGVVGIGPVTPIRQLHIGSVSGAEMVMEKTSASADFKKWNFFVAGADNARSALLLRQLNDAGNGGAISTTWDGNGMMSIYGTAPASVEAGRVAIGGGKIAANEARVNGLITAKEVRVTMSVWADSVFSPSYRLPTLAEVAAHIQNEGHLPGLPSEREVIANGLSVGDMSRMHMAKVEELTLYAIQADARILDLQQKNAAMEARLAALEKSLASLASNTHH
jgi:hypothetical protein